MVIATVILVLVLGLLYLYKEGYNFESGTKLAVHQDELISKYKSGCTTISKKELQGLQNNLWVKMAAILAPGNLVVRQWCLIDLFGGMLDHEDDVRNMVDQLSYRNPQNRLWAEGYSYYLYTKDALDLWMQVFEWRAPVKEVREMVEKIDVGFVNTAYLRGDVWYPSPYGDLWDQPLSDSLQIKANECRSKLNTPYHVIESIIMIEDTVNYVVMGRPIGLNVHIPKDTYSVKIVEGVPEGFGFYTGIGNKYENKREEIKDVLDPERIKSLFN